MWMHAEFERRGLAGTESGLQSASVAVSEFTGENEDVASSGRRAYAALPLAAEFCMDLLAPVILSTEDVPKHARICVRGFVCHLSSSAGVWRVAREQPLAGTQRPVPLAPMRPLSGFGIRSKYEAR